LNSSDSQTVRLEIFGHTKTLTVVLVQHADAFEKLAALSAGADRDKVFSANLYSQIGSG
jgi:hypothetical protein